MCKQSAVPPRLNQPFNQKFPGDAHREKASFTLFKYGENSRYLLPR